MALAGVFFALMLGLVSSRLWDIHREVSGNTAQIEHHVHE